MSKRALITGITGQDGAYLAQMLLRKGYEVFGLYRRVSTPNFWRLQTLEIFDQIVLIPADMSDMTSLLEALSRSHPDEIYNLAAQSFVGSSFETPLLTADVDGTGVTRLLEAIRISGNEARLYQASTSEIYGNCFDGELPLNEESHKRPASPYAAAKLYAHHTVRIFREGYGLFAVNGILFNHESPLRGLEFLPRKVSNAAAKIKLGLETGLRLGNLGARRDWGFAPEYVEAMWLMLQQPEPEDFVIASGTSHSVEELVKTAFEILDLDAAEYVRADSGLDRPLDVDHLLGDSSKASSFMGWKVQTGFEELVETMVRSDYEKWQRRLAGEVFPWDAPNYPTETRLTRGPIPRSLERTE